VFSIANGKCKRYHTKRCCGVSCSFAKAMFGKTNGDSALRGPVRANLARQKGGEGFMTSNRLRFGAQWVTLLLSLALVAYGQTISGSISGHVYDAQMAPIQDATVTITDLSKNFTAGTKTGPEGNFLAAGLSPGNYSVTVEAPGFKKFSQTSVP